MYLVILSFSQQNEESSEYICVRSYIFEENISYENKELIELYSTTNVRVFVESIEILLGIFCFKF